MNAKLRGIIKYYEYDTILGTFNPSLIYTENESNLARALKRRLTRVWGRRNRKNNWLIIYIAS